MANKNKKNASPRKSQIKRFAIDIGFIIGFIVFLVIEFFVFTTMAHLYGKTQITLAQISVMISGTFVACISAYGVTRPENIRKFFGWLISTGAVSIPLKILRWFFSILLKFLRGIVSVEGMILCGALVLMVLVVVEFFCWRATEFFEVENAGIEPSELLIVTLGAIGAACGLILAARRSAKFSEQVDTGQKQLFNEQLGRGAELLTRKEMVMRRTGIRVLEDLAKTTINKPDQVKLIMRIIHDFVHEKTSSPSKDKERLDIALGIRTLASLYNEVDKSDGPVGFIKLLNFSWRHLEKLDFRNAELQGVDFRGAELQGADFRNAKLERTNFRDAKLERANFRGAKLERVNFRGAKLERARFYRAKLKRARFYRAELQGANFVGAELQGANFDSAELQGAIFIGVELQGANFIDAELEWVDCTGADFSGAKNLKKEQVGVMIFDTELFPKLPKGFKDDLDPKRGYEWKKDQNDKSNRRYFVGRGAKWSGKSVDEYLASIRNPKDDG